MWRTLATRASQGIGRSSSSSSAIAAAHAQPFTAASAVTATRSSNLSLASSHASLSFSSFSSSSSSLRLFSSSSRTSGSGSEAEANPFAADSGLWNLDVGSGEGGEGLAYAATESAGQVLGVNKGIVSIDGVHTAHVGACVQFFVRDDVRGFNQAHEGEGKERKGESSRLCVNISHRIRFALLSCPQPTVVAAWGLVVSIHRDFAKALILGGSEESVSVGMSALHIRGHVPALEVRPGCEHAWAGGVFDALGRKLDPQTLQPLSPALPQPVIMPQVPAAAEDQPTTAATDRVTLPDGTVLLPLLTMAAPSLAARNTAHAFLPTGLLHLDAFHPLAEGLRVGIMGPKRSGKTALAAGLLGSLSAQQRMYEAEVEAARAAGGAQAVKDLPPPPLPSPLHFIYVCVGQSRFEVRALLERLSRNGALAVSTVIVAAQDDPMGMQYLAPFLGATLSDWYRSRGESSLLVFDDLAAHGHVLTQINAMYGYPILPSQYVHARLLERIGPLLPSDPAALGTGATVSSTALVLAETARSDRDVAVNLNLGSAVDHALWLDASLASKGLFPALACGSILGRPAAKYRPHVLRALSDALCQAILASNHRANTAAWAAQFGLREELNEGDAGASSPEEDDALIQFKDKCQLMLTQKGSPSNGGGGSDAESAGTTAAPAAAGAGIGNDPLTLAEQFVLLHALQKDGSLLAHVSLVNVWRYRAALLGLLHGQSPAQAQASQNGAVSEHLARAPQLYARLQRALRMRVAKGGNSTAGDEAFNTKTSATNAANVDAAAAAASSSPPSTTAAAAVAASAPQEDDLATLQRQLDLLLDDFNVEFRRKYEH